VKDAAFIGLYRLQNIHSTAAADTGYLLPVPAFVGVPAVGVNDVYDSLRRIDASRVSSHSGDHQIGTRGKCIVLDFSTTAALTTILRQVNRSVKSFCLHAFIFARRILRRVRRADTDFKRNRENKNRTRRLFCVHGMTQYSIRQKRSAIRAQAVYFLHSTMLSVTCLRLSDVSVIYRVTYFQFPIQSAFLPYYGLQAAPALRRTIGFNTVYRTSNVAENLCRYVSCTERTSQGGNFCILLTVKI